MQPKLIREWLKNIRSGIGFYLQPDNIALSPIVHLHIYQLQQIARLFFMQIKIAVTRRSECAGRNDLIAPIYIAGVAFGDEIVQKNVTDDSVLARHSD